MYDINHLYEATSVEHAVQLRVEQPQAKIISGGSDILISIRAGDLAGCDLISLYGLDQLRGVSLDHDGTLRIGSLTSFTQLEEDGLIREHIPVLAESAGTVGGPQIRNIGTVGGNTCNGVTSADTAGTLLAHDAIMELTGSQGVRLVPLTEFYLGAKQVDLAPDEIATAILIRPDHYRGYFGAFFKYAMRDAMDIATSSCSVNVKLSPDKKTIEDARISYGVAGPVPLRTRTAEEAVRGKPVSMDTIEAFAAGALEDVNPRTSWRATREFRLHIQGELARRCLVESIRRAGGNV
ncbi:MAG: xanthine dehydrogenase FAD-binding subunit XdhB [Clostridiaceae bacterium]|jgi:xanthine dehydrogenase FAD-binding subunit|nr:xanthine dehydrogenase FAD-binding subunit XdhB [Clostridiaceae bacterium]